MPQTILNKKRIFNVFLKNPIIFNKRGFVKLVLYFIALLSFACVKETNTVTNNGGSNPITSGTTTTTTTSATTSGGSGSSCTGTVADGYCEGTSCYPLHIRNIGLAGNTDWAAVADSIWNPVTHEG